MAIEKPAIIMNEAGFRILIEALTGAGNRSNAPIDDVVSSNEVDALLLEYNEYKRNEGEMQRSTKEQLQREAALVADILGDFGPMKVKDLVKELKDYYGIEWETKQSTSRLNTLMKYNPNIQKVRRGLYDHSEINHNE